MVQTICSVVCSSPFPFILVGYFEQKHGILYDYIMGDQHTVFYMIKKEAWMIIVNCALIYIFFRSYNLVFSYCLLGSCFHGYGGLQSLWR
jgi:hypothetical protein